MSTGKKHIMLSYCRKNAQSLVYEIYDQLRAINIPVWMDIREGPEKNLNDMLASAIENSAAVCFFMTPEYQASKYCRRELEYADALEIPLIACRLVNGWKPTGWLGILSTGLLFYDFRDLSDVPINETLNKLINFIQLSVLKVTPTTFPDLDGRPQPCYFQNRAQYLQSNKSLDDDKIAHSSSTSSCALKKDVRLVKTLIPLTGYAQLPVVSLEEAIQSIEKFVNIPHIQRNVIIAKHHTRDGTQGLTHDESAAISLYTMEWSDPNQSIYRALNRALRTEDWKALQPWFPYLKLFLSALYKLPSTTVTVWRGIRLDFSSQYEVGMHVTWWGVSSCSTSLEVLETPQFIGTTGVRTLFSVETVRGKIVSAHSCFPQEKEILLLPGCYLEVMSKLRPGNDLTIIHLKEIEPPYPLLQHPFETSSAKEIPTPCGEANVVGESNAGANCPNSQSPKPTLNKLGTNKPGYAKTTQSSQKKAKPPR